MGTPIIGFIGFGEAGSVIASGLRKAGASVYAYDIQTDSPLVGSTIRERADKCEATLVNSSKELADSANVLLSTVTADAALDAAHQTASFLRPDHFYADLNSVSPETKRIIAQTISAAGAHFVEGAIMSPVTPQGHRVPMLLGGADARQLAAVLEPFGMRLEVVSDTIGTAAAVKMFRSIVVKGLEALIFECVLGAAAYDADERVFASLSQTFPGVEWKKLADYMVGRVVLHGERRAREMEEVAETLRSIGIEPIMAEATARRQDWCASLGLKSQFGPDGPATYRAVLDAHAHSPSSRTKGPTVDQADSQLRSIENQS